MKTPQTLARVLVAALILDGGLANACLHGAKGNEQTSVVNGGTRVDRIRVSGGSGRIMKVFVGPKGLKDGSGIRGIALSGEAAELHKGLATFAAAIGREGQPATRSLSKGFSFEGTGVTGTLTELTAAAYPDWKAVVSKLQIESQGANYDEAYTRWLRKIQSSGRAAYALQADAGGGPMPMLAIQIAYPGGDVGEIIGDKMLETAGSDDVPSITWFQGLSNEALEKAVGSVATAAGAGKYGKDFNYDIPSVGAAALRVRVWSAYDEAKKAVVERPGVLWMK